MIDLFRNDPEVKKQDNDLNLFYMFRTGYSRSIIRSGFPGHIFPFGIPPSKYQQTGKIRSFLIRCSERTTGQHLKLSDILI